MQNNPVVSVIIPNYNHAPYLPQRINSVLGQTFPHFELIILDDCSPDESREVIREFATQDARIRMAFNDENSGSTFKQWNKGVGLAQGDYIWIAESDDFADECFLEKLVPILQKNKNIGMVYCMSHKVNEKNEIIGDAMPRDNENLDPDRWEKDFVNNGVDECANVMIFKNVIANASGLVFQKEVFVKCGGAAEKLKLCGDWLTYAKMLKFTDVAYVAERLNYFRVHSNTVRKKKSFSGWEAIWERFQVLQYVTENFEVSPENHVKALVKLVTDFFRQKGNITLIRQEGAKWKEFVLHLRNHKIKAKLIIGLMGWTGKKIKKRVGI